MKLAFDLVHPPAGELHQRYEQGLIVVHSEVSALLVLQVSRANLIDKLGSEGAQVVEFYSSMAVKIVVLLLVCVRGGPAFHERIRLLVFVKVGVDYSCFGGLISPVKDPEHVSANQLIVAVNDDNDGVLGAVVDGGEVDVLEGSESPRVLDVSVFVFGDGVEGEEAAVEPFAAVGGGVVDEHHLVVRVVLREDGVEVALDAEVGVVVEAGHHQAHRQLLPRRRKAELRLQPQPVPSVLLDRLPRLLLAADHVVPRQQDVRPLGLPLHEAPPLTNELLPLPPRRLVLVEHVLDPA